MSTARSYFLPSALVPFFPLCRCFFSLSLELGKNREVSFIYCYFFFSRCCFCLCCCSYCRIVFTFFSSLFPFSSSPPDCSILGMNLFGCKFCDESAGANGLQVCDRKNFDTLLWATVTVFQVSLSVSQSPTASILTCCFVKGFAR